MNSQRFKKIKLPDSPGVYFFMKGKEILYIGKATFLKDRVRSYFSKDLIETRGPMILDMVTQSTYIKWQETDSVLEALILEANLIKKYQPKYNTKEKDNKSFNYVCITDEKIPRVLVVRGRNIKNLLPTLPLTKGEGKGGGNLSSSSVFGPFPNGMQLKEAMKIIRRIFPYVDDQSIKKNNVEFYKQLGLIPSVGEASQKNASQKVLAYPTARRGRGQEGPDHFDKHFSGLLKEYKNNLKNIKLFFQGKKKNIIADLKKEMIAHAKKKEFEKAGIVKKKIFALEHINDVSLIKEDILNKNSFYSSFRIEAYDIAHLAGKSMVGVMVVMKDDKLSKNDYRKFIVRSQNKSNDIGALKEVLSRRLNHAEWILPSLIVVDGSVAQINIAKSVLKEFGYNIPVVSVVKDERHKAKALIGNQDLTKKYKKQILSINSEAHRFAITFHKQRRNKNFLI